ncbi:MAG TPA: transposase [Jiangellaceae bacterium]|nr:transposase [Jiangellaceae bacterium]
MEAGTLPECWIPPEHVLEIRAKVRLYKDLLEERGGWQQRIHATLFHLGAPVQPNLLGSDPGRLARLEALSPATRQATAVALRMIEALDGEIARLRAELVAFARRQLGCRELQHEYGIGALTSVVIWSELGDARRFANSRNAVRHTGLDVSVYSSDRKHFRGHLTRQGPPLLRWALYEAGRCAARQTSPDHAYYERVARRVGKQRATLSVARARPPLPPPVARSRRGRVGSGGLTIHRRGRSMRSARRSLMPCSPLPNRHCRQPRLDGPERPSGCTPASRGTPSIIMSPSGQVPLAHRDKPGRPRTRSRQPLAPPSTRKGRDPP